MSTSDQPTSDSQSNPQEGVDWKQQQKAFRESFRQHQEYARQVEASNAFPMLDCISLMASTRKQSNQVTEKAKTVVKAHYRDPFQLVNFIQGKGTPVYVMPAGFKSWILRMFVSLIGIDMGFVPYPRSQDDVGQFRYNMLKKVLIKGYGEKPGLSFDKGVFILPTKLFNVGFIAHQLHHWLSCMAGLPGYSEDAQGEFKKFMVQYGGVVTHDHASMSEDEIVNLRDAIHREMEALEFLKNVTEELFRPMRQAQNIRQGTANA